jgi:hypothetical protein
LASASDAPPASRDGARLGTDEARGFSAAS